MASSFSFNISKSLAARAVWFEDYIHVDELRTIRKISYWIFWLFLFTFLFVFLGDAGEEFQSLEQVLLGASLILFSYVAALILLETFANSLKRATPFLSDPNIADRLVFDAARPVIYANRLASKKKFKELDSTTLLYFLLKEEEGMRKFICNRALLDEKDIMTKLKKDVSAKDARSSKEGLQYSKELELSLLKASRIARDAARKDISLADLLGGLVMYDPIFKNILVMNDLQSEDIYNLGVWYYEEKQKEIERKKFWLKKNLRRHGSFGKSWAAGYTITLDSFSKDITQSVERMNYPKAIGHAREQEILDRILSRKRLNNALLIGEPGSGRKRLIWDFTSKSELGEHSNHALNYQRVVELDLPLLLSTLESTEAVEQTLEKIFQETARAKNVILFIDEFHNFVGGGTNEEATARMNIAGNIASYLKTSYFPIIATTTYAGLHRYIEQNPSILSFFEKVEIEPISEKETLSILTEIVPSLETTYKKFISYPALKSVVAFSQKYIQAVPLPKKAIDVLDEVVVGLAQGDEKILLPHHVADIVSERTGIPVGETDQEERETLLHMEKLLHQRIVDQEEAVGEISSALRRARSQVSIREGPMGSFLFLGPTGVGKTETAKALAAIYFGSESRMIRLDMSEFQNLDDIKRLLGTTTQQGALTTPIRENPFSILLLDELEKAHPNVLNLFLQVLDEGHITDGLGRKVDFRHTIIIATSNAGYQIILMALKQGKDFSVLKREMINFLFEEGVYRPEFINRFDGVVLFKPLEVEHLLAIAHLMLGRLQKNLAAKGIEFVITESLKKVVAERGYDPTFGARNMRRVIQDKVENSLASALLSHRIKRGDKVTVGDKNFEVIKL